MKTISRRGMIASGLALGAVSRVRAADAPQMTAFTVDGRGRPIVQVTLGDKGTFRFYVDSGRTHGVIRQALIAQLGLEGTRRLSGATLKGVRDITAVAVPQPVVAGSIPLALEEFMGANQLGSLDGILPAGILTAARTEIDFDRLVIRRLSEEPAAGYTRLDVDNHASEVGGDRKPVITAIIDGRPAKLQVGTATGTSILLEAGFMRKQKLWDAYPRFITGFRDGGPSGGVWPTRTVRPQGVSLGGVALPGVIMTIHDPKSPWMGHADGYIGIDVLRRLNMVFDSDRRALWIKPNKAIAEPYNYDRSGMEFRFGKYAQQAAVTWIMPGGPADKAGIIVGDRLTAINSLEDRDLLDEPFRGPPGSTVPVKLERAGQRWTAQLVLAEIL